MIEIRRVNDPEVTCRSTMLASAATGGEDRAFSWIDLGICIQHEAHPAAWQAEEPLASVDRMVSENLRANNKKFTFGWGDFPLCSENRSVDNSALEAPLLATVSSYSDEEEDEISIIDQPHMEEHNSITFTSFGWADFPIIQAGLSVSKRKYSVRFSTVRTRVHSIVLGDHPLCSSYPVALGWDYDDQVVVLVDDFEDQKSACCWDRSPMRMDVIERRSKLAHLLGVTKQEIDDLERRRKESLEYVDDNPIKQLARIPTARALVADV